MVGLNGVAKSNPEIRTHTRQFVQEAVQKKQVQDPGQIDQNQLSDELLEEVGRAGTVDPQSSNFQSMLGALGQNFLDQRIDNPVAAAAPANEVKTPQKETIIEWTPKVRKGEVIEAHAPIGDVVVKERSLGGENEPAKKAGPALKGGGKSPAPVTKGGQPNPNKATGPGDAKDEKGGDDVNLSPESQQMAQKLQSQGVQVPGVTDGKKARNDNSPGEKIVQQGEVTTRCGGVSQSVEVTAAGRLGPGSYLRIYQKLDDMPDYLTVGFKGKTGDQAVEDYHKKVEKGEVARPLTSPQLEQLRNPSGGQK